MFDPDNPTVGQRVRSTNDGQVGYTFERPAEDGGGIGVKLDRKQQNIVLPWSKHKWVAEERGPLTPIQAARVAYAADAALRSVRGDYAVKAWQDMREPDRLAWIAGLPAGADDERKRVHAAVVKALKG